MNESRARRLAENAISTFKLDLDGLIVLTEAATGYYVLTPMIAAMAGAQKTLAIARDSRFGSAKSVRDMTQALARRWKLDARLILLSRDDDRIGQADIVTNLGFVRPLNRPFLRKLKPTAVVPLMWETWEFRAEDLDLIACRELGIAVLGTNEHHPQLSIFEYIGHIALKLLLELGIEVFRSRVVIIGSGEFAAQAATTLKSAGSSVVLLTPGAELQSDNTREILRTVDALVVIEHQNRAELIGPKGWIRPTELYSINPGIVVAHVCGGVDRASLAATGLMCAPNHFAEPGYMSVATDYVGPRPLIDLHTAGLKVGELMARARTSGLSAKETELAVLRDSSLAQGFANYHPS